MPNTTFMQYYPDGGTQYVPQRKPSGDPINGRRASLSEIMKGRNKMDERRKSEAISEKSATVGGIQSLRQGKLPSNAQLDKIMTRLMSSRAIENNKRYMSADGQQLLQDFKELIQVFQRALQSKNRDELFQSMIYHVKRSEEAYQRDHTSTGISSSTTGSNSQNVKEEVKSGAGAILKIAKLFLFNTEFRGLLEQILTIAQQTVGVSLQEGGKALNDKSKDPKLSKGESSGVGGGSENGQSKGAKLSNAVKSAIGGSSNDNQSKGAKLSKAVKSAVGKTSHSNDNSSGMMMSENNQTSRDASNWDKQNSRSPSNSNDSWDTRSPSNSRSMQNAGSRSQNANSWDKHSTGSHKSRDNWDSQNSRGHTNVAETLGNDNFGSTYGDQRTGTIFGHHNGGQLFSDQPGNQLSGQHAELPQEHREFLSNRFDEPESALRSTDDAGHNVSDDMNHGAPNPISTTKGMNNGGQTWLNNNMSTPNPMTPSAQLSDSEMPLSTHSTVINDDLHSNNGPNLNLENGYMANPSSIQPTAQVSDSRLRNALATTRADHGYLTNLSSMNPTAQVSDSNLRNSLASASRQATSAQALGVKGGSNTNSGPVSHISDFNHGASVDHTNAKNGDNPMRNEAVRMMTDRSTRNMQKIPIDTSPSGHNTVDNISALENVAKGASALGGHELRADQSSIIDRGADNMKFIPLDTSRRDNSSLGNTGVVKGVNSLRDDSDLRADQSMMMNRGATNTMSSSGNNLGSSMDYTNAKNGDNFDRNEAVRGITNRSAMNMQPVPVDTTLRGNDTVNTASGMENVVIGAGSLGGNHGLRADESSIINRGADNMKPLPLRGNDNSSLENTGAVKGVNSLRNDSALRADQSMTTNRGGSNISYVGASLSGNNGLSNDSSMDNTGVVKGVNSLRDDTALRADQSMMTNLGGSNVDSAPLDTSLRGEDISQHDSSMENTGAVKGVNSLRNDNSLRADQSMIINRGVSNMGSSNAGNWDSSEDNGWSSQQESDIRQRGSGDNDREFDEHQDEESGSRSAKGDGNHTFSAGRAVNKMKQKAGAEGSNEEEIDEDEDSISTKEIIEKLKQIVTSIQKNSEYQEAISTLFSLFGVWGQRLRTGSGGMDRRRSSAVANPEQSEYYKNVATFEAKTIIEDWAGGKSLDPILKQFYNLSNKLKEDDNLRELYEKITSYIKKLLQEPGYASSDDSTDDGDKLVKEIRGSTFEEYKPHVRTLLQQSNDIVQTISNDDTSQEISAKLKDIHNHLWFDGNGNTSFKPQLLNDMRITLLPAVIEQIKYVPLPQIVYSDKQYDIAIENMVLEGDTLMPDVFEIKADDFLRFSPYAKSDYINTQSVNVHMTGIHTTMHDVIFYYKRKSGFPKMSDSGVINLTTGGAGLRISMRITSSSFDQYHTFKVDQCHAHIDKLEINVSSCKHNIMYKVFNPVLTGIVKRQICKTIEQKMVTMFETGDEKLTRHLRISRSSIENAAKNTSSPSTGRPGIFSHAINVLNKKVVSSI